jgi:FlgD Ig-like domain
MFSPYTGYLFDNADNRTSLRIPLSGALTRSGNLSDSTLWKIGIELSTGKTFDRATSIGVSAAAKRDRDPLDLRMPRGVGTIPGVFFSRPEWDGGAGIFATDIRPPVETIETWPVDVRGVIRQPAQLAFAGVSRVPQQFRVMLLDDDRTRSVDLRADPVYKFVPATTVSHFRIVVGNKDAVQEVLDNLLPKEYALGNNFPNPFNPSTTIPLAVPRTSDVALKVYNLLGERVRTLHEGPMEAGRHWIFWDGTNDQGRSVASGVYLVRFTAGDDHRFIGKMILLK